MRDLAKKPVKFQGMQAAIDQELPVVMLVRQGEGWESRVSPAFVTRFGQEMVDTLGLTVVTDDDTPLE